MAKFNQIPRRAFPSLPPDFNAHQQLLTDAVNSLAGYNGEVVFNDHVNLMNNRITNVAPPVNSGDVVSQAFAESNYSASAVRPQLEASGSSPLQTMRQINSAYQRERTSSWLNSLLSTPPSANTATVSFGASGGSTTITVPPTILGLADGTNLHFPGRTDIVANPSSVAISTITGGGGNTATVVTTTADDLSPGEIVYIEGNSAPVYNGQFTATGVTPPDTFTIAGPFGSTSGTGGTVSTGGVYYYAAQKNKATLTLFGPFDADTPQNRLLVNLDGNQIVAVAVVSSGGGQTSQSGGGGTPLTGAVAGGSFF